MLATSPNDREKGLRGGRRYSLSAVVLLMVIIFSPVLLQQV